MKPTFLIASLLLMFSCPVFSGASNGSDAGHIDPTLNQRPLTIVEWRTVEDVQSSCDNESKSRNLGGFGYAVAACSFWKNDFCVIITSNKPTTNELGHELLHCFQGEFH